MIRKFFPVFAIALFSVGLVMTGCEEDVVEPGTEAMKATVDGTDKEASDVVVVEAGSTIGVTGAFGDGSSISISVPESQGTGSVTLSGTSGVAVAYNSTSKAYIATSGTLDITTLDADNIAGTFEFTGVDPTTQDSVVVESGSFSAKRK
jgi:hypothetical protein